MQTIEITNPLEARRCRFAQYRGLKARLILNGVPVTGMIRAVKEDSRGPLSKGDGPSASFTLVRDGTISATAG
jgi:hypothetical protein